MQQTITMRTTTVTSGSSRRMINTSYFRTYRGMLKAIQLILGFVSTVLACVAMHLVYSNHLRYSDLDSVKVFLALMTTTFLFVTSLIVATYLISLTSEPLISKTVFEILYNAAACFFLLIASLNGVINASKSQYEGDDGRGLTIAAAICALVNSLTYLASLIYAIHFYRN